MATVSNAPIPREARDRVRVLAATEGQTTQGIISAIWDEFGVKVGRTTVQQIRRTLSPDHRYADEAYRVERFEDLTVQPDDPDAPEIACRVAEIHAEKIARGEGTTVSHQGLDRILAERTAWRQRGISLAIPGVPTYRESLTTEMRMFFANDN